MWNQRQAWDSKVLTQSSSPDLALHGMASLPGFRFQPTDEELVGFYLKNMVTGNRTEVELINVLDLYRYDPWELPAMAAMQGEREWLFFCPRDKKYPNGARPNRVTTSGYWKATGTDRPVRRAHDSRCIGLKKTLVFYTGKAPKGLKTEWIMNEYRLPVNIEYFCRTLDLPYNSSAPLMDGREIALCRIYKKPMQINLSYPNLFSEFTTMDHGDDSSCQFKSSEGEVTGPAALCQNNSILHQSSCDAVLSQPTPSSEWSSSPTSPVSYNPVCYGPSRWSFTNEMDNLCDTASPRFRGQNPMQTLWPTSQYEVPQECQSSFGGRGVKPENTSQSLHSSLLCPIPSSENAHFIQSVFDIKRTNLETQYHDESVFLDASTNKAATENFTDSIPKSNGLRDIVSNRGGILPVEQVVDRLSWLGEQGLDLTPAVRPDAGFQPCGNDSTLTNINWPPKKSSRPSQLPTPAAKDTVTDLQGSAPTLLFNQCIRNSQQSWLKTIAAPSARYALSD
ncbi:uncharacterized protein [Physcomitrium patens]|uniref:NAC domain-containing protein n=1 Tax=Physcomitrium patens TaxID=3218 RepID=A0A2K1J9R8_PHYPA|nr:NAC domain-containing protein 77-like [Physcomitrium patens]PNR38271.1 hypothetical protein PHYPA_021382 [Physcomitrium patens]|eukprot:XP_024398320.1 NAC domain-containing protein 77-like [Physcomitrella patens]